MAEKKSAKKKSSDAGRGDGGLAISQAAVRKATGKSWQEWFALLDEAGAVTRQHAEIVKLLPREIDGWWRQMVTVSYERARQLRHVHQKASGEFAAAASKTFDCPLDILYSAWDDARSRASWLRQSVTVRKATPNKSMRITLNDCNSGVAVNFYAKGKDKTQVTVDHGKLGSEAEVQAAKASWKEAFLRLQAKLANLG